MLTPRARLRTGGATLCARVNTDLMGAIPAPYRPCVFEAATLPPPCGGACYFGDDRIRLAHGDFRSAGRRNHSGRATRRLSAARHLHGRDLHKRGAAVRGAADVHQDGAAAARRRAVGLVGGDRLLPGRAARRLCLRPPVDALRAGADVGDHSRRGDADRVPGFAALDRRRMGPPPRSERHCG